MLTMIHQVMQPFAVDLPIQLKFIRNPISVLPLSLYTPTIGIWKFANKVMWVVQFLLLHLPHPQTVKVTDDDKRACLQQIISVPMLHNLKTSVATMVKKVESILKRKTIDACDSGRTKAIIYLYFMFIYRKMRNVHVLILFRLTPMQFRFKYTTSGRKYMNIL